MNKAKALKIVNPVMGLALVFQATTGFASDAFSEDTFETLHGTGATVLLICIAGHVLLNWSWIKANFLKRGNVTTA
jgi:hypothetical protein